MFVAAEAEPSPAGDAGDGADAVVPDAVLRRLRGGGRQRPSSVQVRQVTECRASSVHSASLGLLRLASDADWMAAVTDQSVAQTSAQ